MDISSDTATRAPNADAVREASKVASTPALGDEGGVADVPRSTSPEAAKPSGEATRSKFDDRLWFEKSNDELWFETLPVVEVLPCSEGEGETPIAADAKTDDDKEPLAPADVETASRTDDKLFKDKKWEAAGKPALNAQPVAPPPTRTFTFSVGKLA
ncbi:hypothetical protein HPB50_029155 [Hyalomma asiaticum]|nr:hypothetical protein HPB50_029155 [Hyalomma asiaticum]